MGNDLKGKQLGKGLGQRKDGLYYARCRNYRGEREERCFKTLPGGRNSSTYAAIQSGMQPKVLQKLLGHASITTTMNRYVPITDDSMQKAVAQFAKAQEAQKW